MKIRNVEQRIVRAGDLIAEGRNWRTHPKAQREAMRAVLREIGFVGGLLVRKNEDGRLVLIDGHLRAGLDPDAMIPVTVTDLTEQEALSLLTVYDPISAMASSDQDKLLALLKETRFEARSLADLQEALANGERRPMPDFSSATTPSQAEIDQREQELRSRFEERGLLEAGRHIALICPQCGHEYSVLAGEVLKGSPV